MADDDDIVRITGDRGYPHYYRVDLQFFDVNYIACAPFFGSTFRFRQATEQEVATLYKDYVEDLPRVVYCFEEDLSQWRPMPQRKARTFFIVAICVEITILYDEENAAHLLYLGLENTKSE